MRMNQKLKESPDSERADLLLASTYFLIHLLLEVVCFASVYGSYRKFGVTLLVALLYDIFAFTTQGLFGEWMNRVKKVDFGSWGILLLGISIFMIPSQVFAIRITGVIVLGLGNAILHTCGAIATVVCSAGKLFPSSLFVAGGSFGVIIGKTLGGSKLVEERTWFLLLLLVCLAIMEALIVWTNRKWRAGAGFVMGKKIPGCQMQNQAILDFALTKDSCGFWTVCLIAFAITTVRSFMGYAIPIAWKKEVWQGFLMFFAMGAGKAVGGYLTDLVGARKIGIWTSLLCIPFLLFGENQMVISVAGLTLFSMTMPITFGMFLSVVKNNPGLAFGGTTLALFCGMIPQFVIGSFTHFTNCVLVVVLSVLCAVGFWITLAPKCEKRD